MRKAKTHTERGFEDHVTDSMARAGYHVAGHSQEGANYDRRAALRLSDTVAFLKESQTAEWSHFVGLHGAKSEATLRDCLVKALESRGTLDLLRRGVEIDSIRFTLSYRRPANETVVEMTARYDANRLTAIRQLRFSTECADSIDLVLFVNGLPVATAELKSDLTQSVDAAKAQYRMDRLPRNPKTGHAEPLLTFKRGALVHFAVSTELVYMTTRLDGGKTSFLPFNRGCDGEHGEKAPGNAAAPGEYATEYLWREVWAKDAWLDILHNILFVEKARENKDGARPESLIFPRYHQLEALNDLNRAVLAEGPGTTYLIQHSAGSGKTNTIAWCAHKLLSIQHPDGESVYDQVIVLTDRLSLDRQLQDVVSEISARKGVVTDILPNSAKLREALETKVPIVVSTIQKFGYVSDLAKELTDRNFAILIDEAHSSQTGVSARHLRAVLAGGNDGGAAALVGADEDEGGLSDEDVINAQLRASRASNISFFAFTATPKRETLEVFGSKGSDGCFRPFHLYSMRQAIDEGFIHNVLEDVTTYRTSVRLKHDGPNVEVAEAAATRIARLEVGADPMTIAKKATRILADFDQKSSEAIGGQSKAMVVTSSRRAAVRYFLEFLRQIKNSGYPYQPLVAFSGTVTLSETPGAEYTEESLNALGRRDTADAFAGTAYRFLIVANKFQTGFNEPRLHTLYVDRSLSGVMAVQTLSRLNRRCAGKDGTRVVDFENSVEDLESAFQPFYHTTVLARGTSVEALRLLERRLDAAAVYTSPELAALGACTEATPQPMILALLAPIRRRIESLSVAKAMQFSRDAASFIGLYDLCSLKGLVTNRAYHELYALLQFLHPALAAISTRSVTGISSGLTVTHARVKISGNQSVDLSASDPKIMRARAAGGAGAADPVIRPISELIERFNLAHSFGLTEADSSFVHFITERLMAMRTVVREARSNPLDRFSGGQVQDEIRKILARASKSAARLEDARHQLMAQRVLTDSALNEKLTEAITRWIWDTVRAQPLRRKKPAELLG